MKKIQLMILATVIAGNVQAQKISAAKLPQKVQAAFSKMNPNMNDATWEKEKGDYEVNFKQSGKAHSLLFSADGTLLETEVTIAKNELPANAHQYIETHYTGKAIKETAKITDADGKITYEAEVNKTDLIFDQQGKFITERKD